MLCSIFFINLAVSFIKEKTNVISHRCVYKNTKKSVFYVDDGDDYY